jgi:ferredoxin
VCIGCKACEVACKEWNLAPDDGLEWTGESYDNTSALGANSWRHVAFVEQERPVFVEDGPVLSPDGGALAGEGMRWLMSSDVCKHCTHAACLDVCPTGALFRSEFGTVVVQEDVCNGCGYWSWATALGGAATGVAGLLERLEVFPGLRYPRLRRTAETLAAVLGLPIATYTGALVADTAVPVWHEARRELPVLFAASAAASAGASGTLVVAPPAAGPARRLALLGGVFELAASIRMERRLGPLLGDPYRTGTAATLARAAKGCTGTGTALMALAGRRRAGAAGAGLLLLAGSALERWAVFQAGRQSARDPRYTVEPQRERIRVAAQSV